MVSTAEVSECGEPWNTERSSTTWGNTSTMPDEASNLVEGDLDRLSSSKYQIKYAGGFRLDPHPRVHAVSNCSLSGGLVTRDAIGLAVN